MFCYLSLDKLDFTKIDLEQFYWYSHHPPKPISPLTYKNHMKSFCVIIEGCIIKSIDNVSGKIKCEVTAQTARQLEQLQTAIFARMIKESDSFFTEGNHTYEHLKENFQPIFERGELTLYMKNDYIQCYQDGEWATRCRFKSGDRVKIGVRLYGIAYQFFKTWTGRCRIQHQAMVMISE